jgi:hypothetical protein
MKRALFLLLLLIPFTNASAHQPVWGEAFGPIEIENVSTSYAFYQTLQANEVDVFFIEGKKGDLFRGGIQIPDVNTLHDYAVSLALFGPGFPKLEESQLPPEYPEDLGGLYFPHEITEDFYEPFTQAQYWGRQEFNVSLPEDGTYYILVWHPEGKPGKYVIDTGYAERFDFFDMFLFPVWWVRVSLFHQYYSRLAIAGAALLALVILSYRLWKKERS